MAESSWWKKFILFLYEKTCFRNVKIEQKGKKIEKKIMPKKQHTKCKIYIAGAIFTTLRFLILKWSIV